MASSVSALRISLTFFALSMVLVGPVSAEMSPAAALTDELLEKAEEPFFEGVSAYGKREYAQAAAKFKAAFDVIPHADLLFNIARCHEQLNNFSMAVRFYRKYLDTKPVDETAVIHRVRGLKERIGPLGEDPPPPIDRMPPPVVVGQDDGVPWEYMAVGVGVISTALGAVMGLQALTHAGEAREASDNNDEDGFEDAKALAESSAAFADISYVLGAASAGLAIWLFSSKSDDPEMSGLSLGVDQRGFRVRLGF